MSAAGLVVSLVIKALSTIQISHQTRFFQCVSTNRFSFTDNRLQCLQELFVAGVADVCRHSPVLWSLAPSSASDTSLLEQSLSPFPL